MLKAELATNQTSLQTRLRWMMLTRRIAVTTNPRVVELFDNAMCFATDT